VEGSYNVLQAKLAAENSGSRRLQQQLAETELQLKNSDSKIQWAPWPHGAALRRAAPRRAALGRCSGPSRGAPPWMR
jgi:hypothetical protein